MHLSQVLGFNEISPFSLHHALIGKLICIKYKYVMVIKIAYSSCQEFDCI